MRTLGLFVAMGSSLLGPQGPTRRRNLSRPGRRFDAGVSRHRVCAHDQGD
jgi:hypothetical protein